MAETADAAIETRYQEAFRRGEEALRTKPRALSVRFDTASRRVVIELLNGSTFIVPVDHLQGLTGLADDILSDVIPVASGFDIEWPCVDQQFSVEGLLDGRFGNKRWMEQLAERLEKKG